MVCVIISQLTLYLLIRLATSDKMNVQPDALDPNCLTLIVFINEIL